MPLADCRKIVVFPHRANRHNNRKRGYPEFPSGEKPINSFPEPFDCRVPSNRNRKISPGHTQGFIGTNRQETYNPIRTGKDMNLHFKTTILGLFLALLLISSSIGFSRWQLDRAEEKTRILETYQSRASEPASALPDRIEDPAQWRYRKIYTTATPISDHQFLLDNRTHQGVAGFNVLTPFRLREGKLLLVDRGWIPLGKSRQLLPDLSIPETSMRIEGTIYVPYKEAFSLGDMDDDTSGWPRIIQFADFNLLEQRLNEKLHGFTLRLDPAMQHGYLRDWKIIGVSPDKHLGYAFQGFAFAATVLVIFLALTLRRRKKQ